MIESQARVVAVEPGYAWVEASRRSGCESCHASKSCGTATLGRLFGNRSSRVRAIDDVGVRPGDCVVVGLEEETLMRASIAVYLAPLAGLVVGAFAAHWLLPGLGEPVVILAGVGGLVSGFLWLRRHAAGIAADPDYQPCILRRE